jgi:hypothetical protein
VGPLAATPIEPSEIAVMFVRTEDDPVDMQRVGGAIAAV